MVTFLNFMSSYMSDYFASYHKLLERAALRMLLYQGRGKNEIITTVETQDMSQTLLYCCIFIVSCI